ncbi:MAG: peptidoglycan-binding protein [Candidatus Omnitrophica bacterium]|nr:peptidoglycan-binding protein [Candidatus Omnitrophota bacterium]
MLRKISVLFLSAAVISCFSGCASVCTKDRKLQELKNQISVLEKEIEMKDRQIDVLKSSQDVHLGGPESDVAFEVKSRPSAKQIQAALKNAGFNPGKIDGRIGRQTRKAIKMFQKNNGLSVDGKVGKKTWDILKGYLYNKIK